MKQLVSESVHYQEIKRQWLTHGRVHNGADFSFPQVQTSKLGVEEISVAIVLFVFFRIFDPRTSLIRSLPPGINNILLYLFQRK